jgi:hypothetical protein
MSNLEWASGGTEDVVLGYQPRTAVYENQVGGISIRQEAESYYPPVDRDDPVIMLTTMGALAVAWKLIELAHAVGVPKPDRKLMTKPLDLGPSEPPAPLLQAMREAAQ